MSARHDVAVVGEIYVDHVLSGFERWPQPGEEVVTDRYVREVGGGAAATACGLARLGRSAALVGQIGAVDAPWFAARLGEFGVDTSGLRASDGQTGMTVSVSTAEDRSFFTHVGVNRLVPGMTAAADVLAMLTRARHVHFAMPLPAAVAEIVLPALMAAGATTSLDMGYQPVWLTDRLNWPTLAGGDHLMPNEKEAAILAGADGIDPYLATAARLPLRHPMVKLGAAGAAGVSAAGLVTVAPPPVAAVDTTGAGDAFDAGFIDALLDGADVAACLRRACIVGALSTRKPGALGALPDADELWSIHDRTYGTHR